MPSFDVVSSPDIQEIDNAINNTKLSQFNDILKNNIVRRKIDPKFIHVKSTETASGNRVRQFIDILDGISKEDAKKITNLVKTSKTKVQASINGDEVRITGKKRDDLQSMIELLKTSDIKIPLQFQNFRD